MAPCAGAAAGCAVGAQTQALTEVHQELWALKVPAGHAHIVVPPRVVELCQAPVNEAQAVGGVVNDHIVGLNVPARKE